MKKLSSILWIGSKGSHAPGNKHPLVLANEIFWHYSEKEGSSLFEYLKKNTNFLFGTISDVIKKDGLIYVKDKKLKDIVKDLDFLLLTWNYQQLSKKEKLLLEKIENFIRINNSNTVIFNSIRRLSYLENKISFFELLRQNKLGNHIPEYQIIKSSDDLSNTHMAFPFILKANNLSGGKATFLVKNKEDAIQAFRKLNVLHKLNPIISLFLSNFAVEEIMAVQYYNTFNSNLSLFITHRAFAVNDEFYFVYPHVSSKNWCVHTDMKENQIKREDYLAACDISIKALRENLDLFKTVRKIVGINTLAFDFLIDQKGKIIFLEAELKYGPDKNFIEGQESRFKLGSAHYNYVSNELKVSEMSFNNLFKK